MSTLIETVVAQATGLAAPAVRTMPRQPLAFQSNTLYDIWVAERHLIAKEFLKSAELEVAPAREYGALQRLQHLDIAPRPVFYDPDLAPIVIYEFMAGAMWDRRRPRHMNSRS